MQVTSLALLAGMAVAVVAAGAVATVTADEATSPTYRAGCEKQLFVDGALISRMHRVRQVANRPQPTGEKCLVTDKPWEASLNCFGDTVLQDGDLIRLYSPVWGRHDVIHLEYAVSKDGVHFEKPELDIVTDEGRKTNIVCPGKHVPEGLDRYFFGTCVFKDTKPGCPPDQRYKLITGDLPTYVFASPDGVHFSPLHERPSFRQSDTANVCCFDESLGRYVAYVRSWAPLRAVGRCEFDDLSDFGKDAVVFAADDRDHASFDRSRFVALDFYNNAAIKYPYAANAHFMFPSAYYHFPEPPAGPLPNDGVVDLQFAASHDGIHWTRHDRQPYIALQPGQQQLYMASGLVRQGDDLYLYYGVYFKTHGAGVDPTGYITRARLRLDGFVSVDAGAEEGRLTTVPMTFAGCRLEVNAQGDQVRVGLTDERGRPLPGYGLLDCDPIAGDHIAQTVTWRGKSDVSPISGHPVRIVFALKAAKLYAFQFR